MTKHMHKHTFKVGDRVRCIDSMGAFQLEAGKLYTVVRVAPNEIEVDADPGLTWFASRFELALRGPRECADGEWYLQLNSNGPGQAMRRQLYGSREPSPLLDGNCRILTPEELARVPVGAVLYRVAPGSEEHLREHVVREDNNGLLVNDPRTYALKSLPEPKPSREELEAAVEKAKEALIESVRKHGRFCDELDALEAAEKALQG